MNELLGYLENEKILIADTNTVARTAVANILISMGVRSNQLILAANYELAEKAISEQRPKIVIADYDLGKRCGLDLLQKNRNSTTQQRNTLFFLITANASQTAVAQAAEEDVDAFLLKPFTVDGLKNSIRQAVALKLHPSPYLQTIEQGKTILVDGKTDEAIQTFNQALKLNEAPSLAHFYLARANLNKKALSTAQNHFFEGLRYNQLHYKCLVGLYDVLMAKHRHEEAYQIVKRIAKYFPANPDRVSAIFRLAILTQNFDDLENYYKIFISIDERSEDMIRHVSSALVVAGKHFLRTKEFDRARRHFQYAVVSAPRRVTVLRESILSLTEYGLIEDARAFLKKIPQDARNQTNFLAMEYVIRNHTDSLSQVIDHGRELVSKGIHDPVIYNILIKRSTEAGLKPAAEDLVYKASQLWPQQSQAFSELMGPDAAPTQVPASL